MNHSVVLCKEIWTTIFFSFVVSIWKVVCSLVYRYVSVCPLNIAHVNECKEMSVRIVFDDLKVGRTRLCFYVNNCFDLFEHNAFLTLILGILSSRDDWVIPCILWLVTCPMRAFKIVTAFSFICIHVTLLQTNHCFPSSRLALVCRTTLQLGTDQPFSSDTIRDDSKIIASKWWWKATIISPTVITLVAFNEENQSENCPILKPADDGTTCSGRCCLERLVRAFAGSWLLPHLLQLMFTKVFSIMEILRLIKWLQSVMWRDYIKQEIEWLMCKSVL